jgi:hypothetical protein
MGRNLANSNSSSLELKTENSAAGAANLSVCQPQLHTQTQVSSKPARGGLRGRRGRWALVVSCPTGRRRRCAPRRVSRTRHYGRHIFREVMTARQRAARRAGAAPWACGSSAAKTACGPSPRPAPAAPPAWRRRSHHIVAAASPRGGVSPAGSIPSLPARPRAWGCLRPGRRLTFPPPSPLRCSQHVWQGRKGTGGQGCQGHHRHQGRR